MVLGARCRSTLLRDVATAAVTRSWPGALASARAADLESLDSTLDVPAVLDARRDRSGVGLDVIGVVQTIRLHERTYDERANVIGVRVARLGTMSTLRHTPTVPPFFVCAS